MPRIDACHDSLGGNTYFSSLDMRSGYWQVPVREEDIDKTCFVTRKGIFGFRVLPFGLCNAPSTFQRLVDMALAGLTWEINEGVRLPDVCFQQAAVGLQGSGGTLNSGDSAEEKLKASVSNEGRMNVLL